MADINNYGAPGDALDAPSLSIWAGAVVDVLNASNTTVDDRINGGLATKADTVHTHVEADITDLGSYPDATGVSAGQMAQTDGANGWIFANSNFVIALPTADPVPPGTPSGTIIVRY